jgi:putative redox protein
MLKVNSPTLKAISTAGVNVQITSGNHSWIADEEKPLGEGLGPNPYDLLLAALASCTLITLRLYANQKGWPLKEIEMELSQEQIHAKDCQECESNDSAKINLITGKLTFKGALNSEQKTRLMAIAHRCPVHKTLKMETQINLSEGEVK